MIVCVCNSVSDRDIARAIEAGASTVKEVARRTGAGTCCGSCRHSIRHALGVDQSSAKPRVALPILAALGS